MCSFLNLKSLIDTTFMHALILALYGTDSGSYLSRDHTTTTMTSINTTITNNNISTLGADSSGSAFAIFVAVYLDINTGSAEREAETAAQSITHSFFQVSNLIGVTFSDSSGKPIKVPDTNTALKISRIYFLF